MSYDDAVVALYRAGHDVFVAERKRLSTELKAGGDKAGAARLAKLGRPPVSAWAVNQLWWQAKQAFDELLHAAERLREGDRAAAVAHREALAKLRARAAALLVEAGHAANEATLRRVTTTLSAVAAAGGFDPDPPGALVGDRDPPGFDVVGLTAPMRDPTAGAAASSGRPVEPVAASPKAGTSANEAPAPEKPRRRGHGSARADAAGPERPKDEERVRTEAAEREKKEEERARSEAAERQKEEERARKQKEEERARNEAAERRRVEEKLARDQAERTRLDAALRAAKGEVDERARTLERLRDELQRAESALQQARAALADLEARRARL